MPTRSSYRSVCTIAFTSIFLVECLPGNHSDAVNTPSNPQVVANQNVIANSNPNTLPGVNNPTTAAPSSTTSGISSNIMAEIANSIASGIQNSLSGGTAAGTSSPTNSANNTPSSGACVNGDAFTCSAEAALVKYTNVIRAKHGLAPFAQDFNLSYVARDWSKQQGSMISHTGFPSARNQVYRTTFPNTSPPSIEAENVALNAYSTDPDAIAKALSDQWEGSPGHLANILGNYKLIGAGISCTQSAQSNSGGIFGAIFGSFGGGCTGTQDFGN